MLAKLLDFIIGEKCPHCGARGHRESRFYQRGYNHLCRQAAGDRGKFCQGCLKVYFEASDEEYMKTLPSWCTYKGRIGHAEPLSGFTDFDPSYLK